ncbi:hypothetical protein DITRI_Ditri08aG0154000 [Diplodiscus trichospermus]
MVVAVRPKPEYGRSLSSFKQAKRVGKKVLSDKGQAISCPEKVRPFGAEWYATRLKIKKVLSFYRDLLDDRKSLSQDHGKSLETRFYSGITVHVRIAKLLQSKGKWVNTSRQIGHVLGIKVGDEFLWRGELSIVGLHHEFQKGIDCMKMINGKTIAISIVDSGRYENNATGIASDQLVYCGQGENPNIVRGKKPKDQKLAGGNLALKNSMDEKRPVRVIRRINKNGCGYRFVYDGLYRVTEFWKERGEFGKYVYKFLLKKC